MTVREIHAVELSSMYEKIRDMISFLSYSTCSYFFLSSPSPLPSIHEVLCGRGGRINAHSGNVKFRELVNDRKKDYLAQTTKKLEKAHIAAGVVKQIRDMNPPGRFSKEDADGSWFDIGKVPLLNCRLFCCLFCARLSFFSQPWP